MSDDSEKYRSGKYRATPIEQTYPSRAALKRKAAERREAEAVRLRAEAAELLRSWDEHRAKLDAQRAAARNVAVRAAS